jgi:replicative DNA helicase
MARARFDLDAERAVLGSLVATDTLAVRALGAGLTARDFHDAEHGAAFAAAGALLAAGRRLGPVALADAVAEGGLAWYRAHGAAHFGALTAHALAPDEFDAAVGAVRRMARARRVLAAAMRVLALGARDDVGDAELVDDALAAMTAAAGRDAADDGATWHGDDVRALADRLADADGAAPRPGVPTGLTDLDDLTGGLQPGDLACVAARTGQGKTAFALGVAVRHALAPARPPVLFVSLEMTPDQLAARTAAMLADVPHSRVRAGAWQPLADAELQAVSLAANALAGTRLRVVCRGTVTVADVRAHARALQAEHGAIGLVVVDYLQLVAPDGARGGNRQEDVAGISRGLRALALDLGVPVLALSQLNRAADERAEPQLRDLRESGAIEHDCALILFLWPATGPGGAPVAEADDGSAEVRIVVGKNRAGPTGAVAARFERRFARFADAAPDGDVASYDPYAARAGDQEHDDHRF